MDEIFVELAKTLLDAILALLSILEYWINVRSLIVRKYGKYSAGFVDGIVLTLIVIAVLFFVQSLLKK